MDVDEIEMSEEELQKWVEEEVHKSKPVSPDVLEKCNMLQSHLERREKRAADLLKLCESVAACEAIVQKQYSLLGWDYTDTQSEDDGDKVTNYGPSLQSVRDSDTQDKHSSATYKHSSVTKKLQCTEHLNSSNANIYSLVLKRKAVVVLTKLPEVQISAVCPSTPKKCCSENEPVSLLCLDSQVVEEDSRDPDFNSSRFKTGSKNKRKFAKKKNESPKAGATPQAKSNTELKINATKTGAFQDNVASDAKHSTKVSPPRASTNSTANKGANESKTLTPGANASDKATTKNTNESTSVTAPSGADGAATQRPLGTPETEISVNQFVLARRRDMSWQRGQIKEIQTKEDGRVKYKVFFENKGKSLVSGHHVAFDCMPRADLLFVGARVVMERPEDKEFLPGILAELPNRKNRMRFLVFTDDHKPFYVGLRLLHLVYKPLPDPLADIINEDQRNFVKEYLERWPYPPQTQYRNGQIINAEVNGTLQTCEVQVVDCSLIHVMFQQTQHKEWLYRGSLRLEHMINMKKTLEMRKNLTSTTNVSH